MTEDNPNEIKDFSEVPKNVLAAEAVGDPTQSGDKKQTHTYADPIEILDFNDSQRYLKAWSTIKTLNQFCVSYLRNFRPATTSKKFVPYVEPRSRIGVPCLGKEHALFDTPQGAKPLGKTNYQNWTYGIDNIVAYLIRDQGEFLVEVPDMWKSAYITLLTLSKEQGLSNGSRYTRSQFDWVAQAFCAFLLEEINTEYRRINTDAFGQWMYNRYVEPVDPEYVYIIPILKLRDYMKEHLNACPISWYTLCLNLIPGSDDATLGKLSLFNSEVIVDFSSSVVPNDIYNGVAARKVKKLNASPCDPDMTELLNRTFTPEEADIAIFVNSFPILSSIFQFNNASTHFDLHTYQNSIQDQVVAFFGMRQPNVMAIPLDSSKLAIMIQNFRVMKTVAMQMTAMSVGQYGWVNPNFTSGKAVDPYCADVLITGAWEPVEQPVPLFSSIAWIPFEYMISNGSDLEIDKNELVTSLSGNSVNSICEVPRSVVPYTINDYNSVLDVNINIDYYIPNSETSVKTIGLDNLTQVAHPETVPAISSSCDTSTVPYDRDYEILHHATKYGKNDKHIFIRRLGFITRH